MLVALYFMVLPYLNGLDSSPEKINSILKNLNNTLMFMGLSVSFSSLQDTTKTQNNISRKIWEDPIKGKITIAIISMMILFCIISGFSGYFNMHDNKLKDLSIGIIVFGIGLIGMLKSAIEMFENHRLDKNAASA